MPRSEVTNHLLSLFSIGSPTHRCQDKRAAWRPGREELGVDFFGWGWVALVLFTENRCWAFLTSSQDPCSWNFCHRQKALRNPGKPSSSQVIPRSRPKGPKLPRCLSNLVIQKHLLPIPTPGPSRPTAHHNSPWKTEKKIQSSTSFPPRLFVLLASLLLLTCSLHTASYEFEVYTIITQHLYTPRRGHHSKSSHHPSLTLVEGFSPVLELQSLFGHRWAQWVSFNVCQ